MDFWINITTYRREQPLRRLLDQIKNLGKNYSIEGLIIIDHCLYNTIKAWNVMNMKKHEGRQGFYNIMNIAFSELKKRDFRYFLNLQDDIILEDGFFEKCIDLWEGIKDRDKIVLDLRNDERAGRPQWGIYPVAEMGKYYKSQWFDLIFMSDSSFKDHVPFLKYHNINSSSGVARQMTKLFRKNGLNMYHSKEVLLHHGQLPSLMNPEFRKKEKLIC